MKKEISVYTDSVGDTFVSGYNRYTKHGFMFKDHMEQFIKNYETAFGKSPTPEELDAAVSFAYTILAEISETHPHSHTAKHVSHLSWVFGSDAFDAIENISSLSDSHVPSSK